MSMIRHLFFKAARARRLPYALVILLALMVGGGSVFAAPFDKQFPFKQPDGTAIVLHGWGDEFFAIFETLDGYTVAFDPAIKAYCYAALSADGDALLPTKLQVGKGDPAALGLAKHLRISAEARKQQARERYLRWNAGTGQSERWSRRKTLMRAAADRMAASPASPESSPMFFPSHTTTGTKVGLCLLIDFDNDVATISQPNIDAFCNGNGYTGYGNNGSVKEYFYDVSNGQLTYTNVVTVYIRIPNSLHPKSYYDFDNGLGNCGTQANLLIQDAIAIMKARPDYNSTILPTFNNLTVDGSNNVVAANIFYAGTTTSSWLNGLWPHSWSLYTVGAQELSPGGKKVYNYQITDIGSSLTLGTFCHENGHMLCDYPDIYDYGGDSVGGAGEFCLMNNGGHGTNPVQVCAYLKYASGWTTITDLTSSSAVAAALSASGPAFNQFYRYAKPSVSTEYFLLENRQATGRDANIPASGIAVWHIDELGNKDNQSLTPNGSHLNYEVTLVQADNLWDFQNNANAGDANDLYYSGNTAYAYNNTLTDGTAPHTNWWDGTSSSLKLHNFSASGNTMTFGVALQAPVLAAEPAFTPGTDNIISWPSVLYADKYWAEYDTVNTFPSPDANSGWIPGLVHGFGGLLDGVTYWYRAKGRVALPSTATTWGQTTQAEFATDALTNTVADALSDTVVLGSTSSPTTNTVGGGTYSYGAQATRTEFNVYQCTTTVTLTKIESYLVISVSTPLEFVVYESTSYTGIYNRIHTNTLGSSGTGTQFYSSGTISVPLVAGRYYMIGVAWSGTAADRLDPVNYTTAFGTVRSGGYVGAYYPAPTAFDGSTVSDLNNYLFYHRLTSSAPTYYATGTAISTPITAGALERWTTLDFHKTTPANTTLTVDVLDGSNVLLAANVASGTDLNGLGITQSIIKLRANLATTNSAVSPDLADWKVQWITPSSYLESAWSASEFSTQGSPTTSTSTSTTTTSTSTTTTLPPTTTTTSTTSTTLPPTTTTTSTTSTTLPPTTTTTSTSSTTLQPTSTTTSTTSTTLPPTTTTTSTTSTTLPPTTTTLPPTTTTTTLPPITTTTSTTSTTASTSTTTTLPPTTTSTSSTTTTEAPVTTSTSTITSTTTTSTAASTTTTLPSTTTTLPPTTSTTTTTTASATTSTSTTSTTLPATTTTTSTTTTLPPTTTTTNLSPTTTTTSTTTTSTTTPSTSTTTTLPPTTTTTMSSTTSTTIAPTTTTTTLPATTTTTTELATTTTSTTGASTTTTLPPTTSTSTTTSTTQTTTTTTHTGPTISTSSTTTTTTMPTVTVLTPNGGESWAAGTSHDIVWATTPGGDSYHYVTIDLYRGDVLDSTVAVTSMNLGLYHWTIPESQAPGSDYRIRVELLQMSSSRYVEDFSDSPFTITIAASTTTSTTTLPPTTTTSTSTTTTTTLPATITVIFPSATGIQLERGKSCVIQWTSTGLSTKDKLMVELIDTHSGVWLLSAKASNKKGALKWTVGKWNAKAGPVYPNAADYMVRVSTLDGLVSGQSQNAFAIASVVSLNVTGPATVVGGGTAQYAATGIYDFGTARDVTAEVKWSFLNAATGKKGPGKLDKTGLLTTKPVSTDVDCNVQAFYGKGTGAAMGATPVTVTAN